MAYDEVGADARIISACAEQTIAQGADGALERDHLRVCGADRTHRCFA